MTTKNLGLHEYSTAETGAEWCEALNSDNAKLDELPQVAESGGNSQLRYQKWTDGNVHMWGVIDTGRSYECSTPFESYAFASPAFNVNWPVALAETPPMVQATVSTKGNPDIFVLTVNVDSSKATFCFLANFNESLHAYGATNIKILHLDVWGRWK